MQPSVASISILPPPQSTPNNIIPFPQRGITTRFASVGGAMVGLGIFAMELPEILNQAIYDYNGLPRPEQYPYGQDAIDRAMQNAVGTAPLEEIRENARMMEELLLADKVVLNNSQSSDGKTCCKFIWSKFQLGGWPEHDDYAARIGEMSAFLSQLSPTFSHLI